MEEFKSSPIKKHPELGPNHDPGGIENVSKRLQKNIKDIFILAFGEERNPIEWKAPIPAISWLRYELSNILNCTMTKTELQSMRIDACATIEEKKREILALPKPWKIFGHTLPWMGNDDRRFQLQRENDILIMEVSIIDQTIAREGDEEEQISRLENDK
jgi:hypothetical protein